MVYVGNTYKFSFKHPFDSLDGIYSVLKTMTYDETVDDQIDLMALYTKYGKTEDDFNADITDLRSSRVLKLSDVQTGDIVYVPMTIYELEPDPNVKKYLHLALGVSLGVFSTLEQVKYVKGVMQDLLKGGLGVTEEPVVTELTSKQVWLTTDEYEAIVLDRESIKNKTINLYTENIRLRKDLDSAYTKIAAYEQLIKQLQA